MYIYVHESQGRHSPIEGGGVMAAHVKTRGDNNCRCYACVCVCIYAYVCVCIGAGRGQGQRLRAGCRRGAGCIGQVEEGGRNGRSCGVGALEAWPAGVRRHPRAEIERR